MKRIGNSWKKGYAKVNIGIPSKICADRTLLREYSVYLQLKSLYNGGCIHNYRGRYEEIASQFNISASTLRKSISYLKLIGFLHSEGSHLWLASGEKIRLHFGVNSYKKYNISVDENTNKKIQTLIIHENLKSQNDAIKKQFIYKELEREYGTVKNIQYKVTKRLRKILANLSIKEIKKRIYNQPELNKGLNPYATLSRGGIAELLGYKNKSTGSRIVKRLVDLGYLEDVKVMHKIVIRGISEYAFHKLGWEQPYYWTGGKVMKAMPNSISVKLCAC